MVNPVTAVAAPPPLKAARCCSFVSDHPTNLAHPVTHHEIATTVPVPEPRLPDKASGRKIVSLP
jgi:hypothetical protein